MSERPPVLRERRESNGPRLAAWLLEWLLPRDAADAAVGDLDEEFAAVHTRIGRRGARRWYWRQALSLASAYLRNRWTRERASGPPRLSRMDFMQQDIRYALRALGRSPSFTIVALLMLALGIGATSAIFSFVDAVLLRPLPYRDPGAIIRLFERPPGATRNAISALNFRDWQDQNTVFTAMAAISYAPSTLSTAGDRCRSAAPGSRLRTSTSLARGRRPGGRSSTAKTRRGAIASS